MSRPDHLSICTRTACSVRCPVWLARPAAAKRPAERQLELGGPRGTADAIDRAAVVPGVKNRYGYIDRRRP